MGRFARQFGPIYAQVATDIFKFARLMNFQPTWQQEQLLAAVQRGDRQIAVRSGQGPGKSSSSVICALWRTLRRFNAMTILTAPTMRQCNEVWLAEARRLLAGAEPVMRQLIDVTRTKVIIAGQPDWGVKTVTATREENAQGFHEPNMTIICDEASGVARKIIEQFKGTASNPGSMIVMAGNPNSRDCAFFDAFNSDKKHWTCLHWNAEQTPASRWFDPSRNDRLAEEFGKDSDVYRIRVQGEFPHRDPNCVLSTEELELVCTRKDMVLASVELNKYNKIARQIGIDFARYGGDENVVFRRSGNAIVEAWWAPHVDPSQALYKAFEMQQLAGWRNSETYYIADAGGIGQGIMHRFYEGNKRVLEFNNNGVPAESDKYENMITEAWFNLRHYVRKGTGKCYIPDDRIMQGQLTSRQYFMNKKGKLVLESKEEYIKRGHDSPDRADGLVMGFYDEMMTAAQTAGRGAGRAVGAI